MSRGIRIEDINQSYTTSYTVCPLIVVQAQAQVVKPIATLFYDIFMASLL